MKHVKTVSVQPPKKADVLGYLKCKKDPGCAIAKPV